MTTRYTHDVFISFKFENQFIVDTIVNQLTNKYGISCWICTEKVRAGENFRDDIAKAIDAAKIVVFVQSKLSASSIEVRHEIVEAFDNGKIIMPFIIEDSRLNGVLESLLKNIHYIDATKPTLDERIYDLAKDICQTLGKPFLENSININEDKLRLISSANVIPKTIFCGRDGILEEIHDRLQHSDSVLFLYGIGGIGKTQIAKQYAKKHRDDYDTVIYATYNGSIKDMIIAETPFSTEPTINRYTLSDGTKESDDAYYQRKLEAIQKISSEKTLIILDNFDVEDDENLPLLMNGRYRLLITTRSDFSRFYPTLKISSIDSIDELKSLFMNNYRGYDVEKNDPALVDLIELVNRHTYTIELLALHMENSGQTPSEMIYALKERGITSLDEQIRDSNMKTQTAYENLLKMFQIFSLNEEERRILMYLSLMPTAGVSVKDFKKWADIKSPRVLMNLENRSWIIKNTDGIAVHPIIKEVIKHKIPATEENCFDFINRFSESIDERYSWHYKKIDKDKYGAIAKRLISKFKEITPNTELLYYNSEVLLSFAVDPEYAVILATRLHEYYITKCSKESYEVGRAAFKLGWVYAYNTHLPNAVNLALKWLTKADKILTSLKLTTTEEMAKLTQTKVNLAKMYLILFGTNQKQEDYLLAKEYAKFNVEYSLNAYTPGDPQYSKLGGAYWQLADVLLAGGELDSALENIEKALSILISLNSENDSDSMHALNRKAVILYAMGRYREAKQLAQKGTIGYAEFFGEKHPIIAEMYALLGDCCTALGEKNDAKNAYITALSIAEKLYLPEAKQITALKEKIAGI